MQTFLEHSAIELTEALNNPQEYYMTDDTKMPTSIYAAFDIDGMNYIMSLEASSDAGVYILEVGKTGGAGGKTYWWKFHKQDHILPVLATTLHFVQSSTAWLGPKMKGIAVQFKQGASDQMERASRLATRIIKRSYVKSFTIVPVSQPAITDKDKYYHQKIRFLFIAKKNVPLNSLFGGTTFKKYSFDGKEAPAEAIAELTPKKIKKQVNTLKPSKKYSFGQFEVDTPTDEELVDKIQNVKPDTSDPVTKSTVANASSSEADFNKELGSVSIGGANSIAGMLNAMPSMQSMIKALQKYGFDKSKLNWGNLEYTISQASGGEKALLNALYMTNFNDTNVKNKWEFVMKKIAEPSQSETIKNVFNEKQKEAKAFLAKYPSGNPGGNTNPVSTSSTAKVLKSNIDPNNDLIATMPGSGLVTKFDGQTFVEDGGSWEKKKDHIQNALGYHKEVGSLKTLNNVATYSGSKYSNYNNPLRSTLKKLFAGEKLYNSEIKEITTNYSKYQKLFKAFNDIKPLPESLWVYRGTSLPGDVKPKIVPGYEYVDPAFLSTTIKTGVSFGFDRMRIFLPKGSKVVPILSHSKHSSEQEILLPPSSVIKIVEVEIAANGRYAIHGIFAGSAFKSITEMLKKQLTMAEDYDTINSLKDFIMEQEKKEMENKYDPEGKFGGQYDADLADLISKAIADGKVKVDPVKSGK